MRVREIRELDDVFLVRDQQNRGERDISMADVGRPQVFEDINQLAEDKLRLPLHQRMPSAQYLLERRPPEFHQQIDDTGVLVDGLELYEVGPARHFLLVLDLVDDLRLADAVGFGEQLQRASSHRVLVDHRRHPPLLALSHDLLNSEDFAHQPARFVADLAALIFPPSRSCHILSKLYFNSGFKSKRQGFPA